MSDEENVRAKALKWWREEVSESHKKLFHAMYEPKWTYRMFLMSSSTIERIYREKYDEWLEMFSIYRKPNGEHNYCLSKKYTTEKGELIMEVNSLHVANDTCKKLNGIYQYGKFGATLMYEDKKYEISNEAPVDGDMVLTENYGIWEFSSRPAPISHWCNPNACNKLKEVE